MIQIYKQNNINYDANGDRVLFPFVCSLSMELNGTWELLMEHVIDGDGVWRLITKEAVLSVPTPVSGRQLFRIYNTIVTEQQVTAHAKPIFMDAAQEVFLLDKSATLKNGQQVLDILTQGTKYKGTSNIKNTASASWDRKNLMEVLASDEENSFLNCWGGEILYDNYNILLNERAGGDYGTTIRTGKNLTGIKENINMDEVITRILPVAYNGYMLAGDEPWVDSPLINNYSLVYTREVEFSDVKLTEDGSEDEEGTFDTLDELRKELVRRSSLMFSQEEVDKPAVILEVEMIDLANTEDYEDYATLETVNLGDTVHCIHSKLGIETKARIIKVEWDCMASRPLSLIIGNAEYSYLSDVAKTVKAAQKVINTEDNTLMAERLSGILDAMNTQLRYQKNMAQKQDVRAILFEDIDPDSELYGAMSLGTQGFQIANKRTSDGREWDWTTAVTANGVIADAILTGLISDKKGKSWWNLDTGEMQFQGIFKQYSNTGYPSVEIRNNSVNFYDWEESGNYVGSVSALRLRSEDRCAVGIYCDIGDMLYLGWDSKDGTNGNVKTILSFDSNTPNATPWIRNTASGTMFRNAGEGVTIENGLVKKWNLNTVSGTLNVISGLGWSGGNITRIDRVNITVSDGLITGWTTNSTNY